MYCDSRDTRFVTGGTGDIVVRLGPFELAANLSTLFRNTEPLDRAALASEWGFASAESWWPFDSPAPDPDEIDAFAKSLENAGIALTALNFYAGDMAAGDRGVLSHPDSEEIVTRNLAVVERIADRTGCRVFNALYGQRQPLVSDTEQDAVAVANLARIAARLAVIGATVVLEPLTEGPNGQYPIVNSANALEKIRAARAASGLDNIKLLFDVFHLSNAGEDLLALIATSAREIGHVQFADSPGRGEPGTGSTDFAAIVRALAQSDYRGSIGCEYFTTETTRASLAWIEELESSIG
ncbi:MAG: Hydroxypyruvate isomerase [Rhodoglobus sp.]|nr:Hydroxypyruvate isomerase [Rhodoglobus sp.]